MDISDSITSAPDAVMTEWSVGLFHERNLDAEWKKLHYFHVDQWNAYICQHVGATPAYGNNLAFAGHLHGCLSWSGARTKVMIRELMPSSFQPATSDAIWAYLSWIERGASQAEPHTGFCIFYSLMVHESNDHDWYYNCNIVVIVASNRWL